MIAKKKKINKYNCQRKFSRRFHRAADAQTQKIPRQREREREKDFSFKERGMVLRVLPASTNVKDVRERARLLFQTDNKKTCRAQKNVERFSDHSVIIFVVVTRYSASPAIFPGF